MFGVADSLVLRHATLYNVGKRWRLISYDYNHVVEFRFSFYPCFMQMFIHNPLAFLRSSIIIAVSAPSVLFFKSSITLLPALFYHTLQHL